jgi:serine protease Do
MKKTAMLAALAVAFLALTVGLQAQGQVPRPWVFPPLLLQGPGASIGISLRDPAPGSATAGVVVDDVRAGSPAETAGVRRGDVVIEFDGERVRSGRQLSRLVQETAPGRTVDMTVLRDGSRVTLAVSPALARADGVEDFAGEFRRRFELLPGEVRLGVSVQLLTDQLATHFGVKAGLLVLEVEADSPAAAARLVAGDVITHVAGREADDVSDLTSAVRDAAPGATLELRLRRDQRDVTATVTLPGQRRPAPARGRPI